MSHPGFADWWLEKRVAIGDGHIGPHSDLDHAHPILHSIDAGGASRERRQSLLESQGLIGL